MRVLVVGGGGREHALAWKIAQSPLVTELYCAPGNAGIEEVAACVPIAAEDIGELRRFALGKGFDLTVVGPDGPQCAGIVDSFQAKGLKVFGPGQKAARLEGSKVFAKQLMERHNVPTAPFRSFDGADRARAYIEMVGAPLVVKADGLAAGKAVVVCQSVEEAMDAVKRIMIEGEFGDSGEQIVIEQCLVGEEASCLAITDGRTIAVMPSCQDHKAVYNEDKGPNTGGMGAYSPAPVVTPQIQTIIERDILVQTVHAMNREERPYCGVLYAGVMIVDEAPQVLEFNCRFGDPETQPLLMRLKSDLVSVLLATAEKRLDEVDLEWDDGAALCVVMASPGYPRSYPKGLPITGLDKVAGLQDVVVFHAGTKRDDNGRLVTAGGRVLAVTARGADIAEAQKRAYEAVRMIHFENAHYRTDIGNKAAARTGG